MKPYMRRRLIPVVLFVALCSSSCGEPQIVVPDVMTIVALLPTHGSTGVGIEVQPLLYLSHTAASASAVEAGFTLTCLGAAVADSCGEPYELACTDANPLVVVAYDATGQVARLVPDALLQPDTCYLLVVAAGIEANDANVGALPVDVESSFRTR